ncbi:GntR family transcriptional regulator, partial [Salmonella enterica]|nr:GntR family transcriptional regulator [Salmonella enterica]
MVFQDIARKLKDNINGYTYNVGDLLPTEIQLSQTYNVSRNTLRKALDILEKEGMIERKHGSGTYVRRKSFIAHVDHMNCLSEIAQNSGKEIVSQIMRFEVQGATHLISRELNI